MIAIAANSKRYAVRRTHLANLGHTSSALRARNCSDSKPSTEISIMRRDLTDFDWTAIGPFLPNKPRGVPRIIGRRFFNVIFWILRCDNARICDALP
jgi:hypothetical protein